MEATENTDVLKQINKDVLALKRKATYAPRMAFGIGIATGGLMTLSAKQKNTSSYIAIGAGVLIAIGSVIFDRMQKAKDEAL